ncbi:triple tyrosine motif-containing protein [Xanthomonas axonopodis]|uniref:sensor histidine kinase n=1 Tax=Xanthomonas axonopodis TaxID=53413 RepID=UPI0035586B64
MSVSRAPALAFRLVLGWALTLCAYLPAFAQLAEVPLFQLHQMHWTVQTGAPSGMIAMTQTRDGYIWVVASGGLFRFDGVKFERVQQVAGVPLPTSQIYALWARPAGGLWVGYLFGGASFIGEDGTSQHYSTQDGLPPNTAMSFAEDGGRMWIGTSRGLFRLEGGRWTQAETAWQFPPVQVNQLELDGAGTLWAYTDDSLYFRRRGERHFELGLRQANHTKWSYLLKSPDGQVWLAQHRLGLSELKAPQVGNALAMTWQNFPESAAELLVLMIDRDRMLWHASSNGLKRIPLLRQDRTATQSTPASKDVTAPIRLLGETPIALMQDREGNAWVISDGGLSRFRSSAFLRVGLERASRGAALTAAGDGSIWVSDSDHGLHRLRNGLRQESLPSSHENFSALHRDHNGTLWLGGRHSSIYRSSSKGLVEWRPQHTHKASGIQAIASQKDGTLWVSVIRGGVYRVVDNRWMLWGGLAALPREPATSMTVDAAGRLWLGYVHNRLAVVDGNQVRVYSAADGLATGPVQVMAVSGRDVWIGGEKGLARFDGKRFHSVLNSDGLRFGSIAGLIQRAGGELWLNTSDGAVFIDANEVRNIVANPAHLARSRLFDHNDGFPGAVQLLSTWPTAIESTDGRLWFTTSSGVVTLAPRPLPRNMVTPNVYLKSITVDGQRTSIEGHRRSVIALPTKPRVIQLAYTAPSFTMPERVQFRYRLKGSAMGWEDVGTRREAFFTGLRPGNYRFEVVAANESGVWNNAGASVDFVVPPTFVQSRTFLALCVAAIACALWVLFFLRMRQVKAKLQWRSEARLLERERIARDLHDTFLQGVQGLMLRFQSAAERIPDGERARELMEDALDRADRILADGRDKVAELRTSVCMDLPDALAMSGSELARDYGVAFQASVEGSRRALDPLVLDEAFHIGSEAMANAFRHARATRVQVVTVFGRRQLEIRVSDDGSGFDLSGVKDGHWGLKGLRERAARVRGNLSISSKPGVGSTVQLQLPGSWAYKDARRRRWNWRKLLGMHQEDPT